ncbi:Sua5/YciO/YrdC/YwlC family protein [Otariodibacter oris]|uniref:Threonylcarbamoyl-AMP synthase n=1 Tax=Otariodibacter oris TaxID=1032623 RepID=A0A420XEG0_9PAST|nr:Sua5/YciO/YrdC/YwlC family protein [Otariodibacter oris]QGM80190.1 tRNA threonylcarbamoyladenosine biosynthesis protein RimN [Otariodibacter oris]RKR70621.1 L-threonylcarbamoyladenylate synthase [Otariodibacter oris]
MFSFNEIISRLQNDEVIAYPTEAVFGLGCNPNSETAVMKLLALKKRPIEKGLILIAPTKELLMPYIDTDKLSQQEWDIIETPMDKAITWVVPANPSTPNYLTGQFNSIAIRLCTIPAVTKLCQETGFALTSTSANLSGQEPCHTVQEVIAQFGEHFPVLDMQTGGKQNPSEIRDIFTQQILRAG